MSEKEDKNKEVANTYLDPLYVAPSDHPPMVKGSLEVDEKRRYGEELWDELWRRYGESNAPQLYQMKKELKKLEQGEPTVPKYYCKLKTLSDEINCLEEYPTCEYEAMRNCKCNLVKKLNEMKERNKLMKILMGLNMKKYEGMVGNILAMDLMPSMNRAFHLIQQVEKQKQIVESIEGISTNEMSAFNVGREIKQSMQKRDYKKEKMNKNETPMDMKEIDGSSSSNTKDVSLINNVDPCTEKMLAYGEKLNGLYKLRLMNERNKKKGKETEERLVTAARN
ncbi:Type II inositol 3 4-bisphosphate 4-phosphatase, partial [Bienertia sinuspersici]